MGHNPCWAGHTSLTTFNYSENIYLLEWLLEVYLIYRRKICREFIFDININYNIQCRWEFSHNHYHRYLCLKRSLSSSYSGNYVYCILNWNCAYLISCSLIWSGSLIHFLIQPGNISKIFIAKSCSKDRFYNWITKFKCWTSFLNRFSNPPETHCFFFRNKSIISFDDR